MRRMPGSGRPRRAALAAAAAATVLAVCAPVALAPAAATAPTPSDIARAKQQAAAAQAHLGELRDEAEVAVEAYHAAAVKAAAAHRTALAEAAAATQARTAAAEAAREADAARAAATALQAGADRARQELVAATGRVATAMNSFNQIAVAAYETGGAISRIGGVIDSGNPTDYSRRQAMADQVGRYQQSVVDQLAVARADQVTATRRADDAAQTAADAAQVAAGKAAAAATAATRARTAADTAAAAARTAKAAARAAVAAKERAAEAVAHQEDRVHRLRSDVVALQKAMAEARREAALARRHQVHATASAAATAIEWAYKEIGVPYSWGGGNAAGPTYGVAQGAGILGFDCSGLTLFAYAHAGVPLEHWTGSQWNAGPHVAQADLLPGDLLFYASDPSNPATIHHVGLYIGNGQMIEAPQTGLVVRVSAAFRPDYIGAVRPWA